MDELPDSAADAMVRSIPQFVLQKGGAKVGEVTGANVAGLKSMLDEHCAAA